MRQTRDWRPANFKTFGVVMAMLLGISAVACAQEKDDVLKMMEKHAQMGTWASDCNKRASPNNVYTVFRSREGSQVQIDVMDGPQRRFAAGTVESVAELGPNDIEITSAGRLENGVEYRSVSRLRIEGKRRRVIEAADNGKKITVEGRSISSGKPTPWRHKCD